MDTSGVISDLADGVILKIAIVINEATSNFGSEHPDVSDAESIYNNALAKYESGKYAAAMTLFKSAFGKVLGAYECDAYVTVIDFIPDVYEAEIGSFTFNGLQAENSATGEIVWHPTELGIHNIKVIISGNYEVYNSTGTMVVSPPAIMGVGFPVTPFGGEEYWDTVDLRTIDPGETRERTGPLTIYVMYGDLIINSPEGVLPGGKLILNEQVTLEMMNTVHGQYGIDIQSGATFEINDDQYKLTTVKGPRWDLTYPFINRGTIIFNGANVLNTFGDISDPLNTGGIRNIEGGSCILNNCQIVNPETHGAYVDSDSSLTVTGAETLIGSEVPAITGIQEGHGIFVDGSSPTIEGISVQNHKQDGIHIQNSVASPPIPVADLHSYSSDLFDYRMTYDPDDSINPVVVAANGDVLMAYVDSVSNEIYLKKTSDHGLTWTGSALIRSTEGSILNIAMDGDDQSIALVWEEEVEMDYTLVHMVYVVRSTDGGDTWTAPIDVTQNPWTQNAVTPTVAVSGNYVYIAYQSVHDEYTLPIFIQGITLVWGPDGSVESQVWHDESGEYNVFPKLVADGMNMYLVWIRTYDTSEQKDIYMMYSTNAGTDIITYGLVTTFYGDVDIDTMSITARGNQLFIVWSDNEYGNYDLYGIKGKLDGVWLWSPPSWSVSGAGNSMHPVSVLDSDSNWYVFWQDDRGGFSEIRYLAVDEYGYLIVNDMSITPGSPDAAMPSISIDSMDNAYLVWSDRRGDNAEIYIKRIQYIIQNNVLTENNNGIYMQNSNGLIKDNLITDNLHSGVILSQANGVQIESNEISGSRFGVDLTKSTDNYIVDNSIESNGKYGISLYFLSSRNNVIGNILNHNPGYGIYTFDHCNENIISYNTVIYSYLGIYIHQLCSDSMINHNTLTNCEHAIYLQASTLGHTVSYNTITDANRGIFAAFNYHKIIGNILTNTFIGIFVFESTGTIIDRNTVTGQYGHSLRGIEGQSNTDTVISNNIVSDFIVGIHIHSTSDHNIIQDNEITHCYYTGMEIHSSDNFLIDHNVISENNELDILLNNSHQITLTNNEMVDNGIFIKGDDISDWTTQTIDSTNTVNGKPVQYWKDQVSGTVPSGAGQVIIANCRGVTVEDQDITVGSVSTIIPPSPVHPYFRLETVGVSLAYSDGNTVNGNTVSAKHGKGVYLWQSDDNLIDNNEICAEDGIAVYLWQSSDNDITNNAVSTKIELHQLNNKGIYLWDSNDNYIAGNEASDNYYGMYIFESSGTTIESNFILDNVIGIHLNSANDNVIIDNAATSNDQYGISLLSSGINIVENNQATDNGHTGIRFYYSDNNEVTNNLASDNFVFGLAFYSSAGNGVVSNIMENNMDGFVAYNSNDNTITANDIVQNSRSGIYLSASNDNTIHHNNIVFNLAHDDGINQWDDGAEGNHWSDWTAPDANGDGIVDLPYAIPGGSNQDNYPLVDPVP